MRRAPPVCLGIALAASAALAGEPSAADLLAAAERAIPDEYVKARDALIALGEPALAAVRARLREPATALERSRLQGIEWELADPPRAASTYAAWGAALRAASFRYYGRATDTEVGRLSYWATSIDEPPWLAPLPLALERAAALRRRRDLLRAVEDDPRLGVEMLREVLAAEAPRFIETYVLLTRLAERAPDAALDVIDAALGEKPTLKPDQCVEALVLVLDAPRTRSILERILSGRHADIEDSYRYARVPAREALDVLEGKSALADLLRSKDLRHAAALALARRGDAQGVRALGSDALKLRELAYERCRDDLVGAGHVPDFEIGYDDAARVLRDAVSIRIADRAASRRFDERLDLWQPRDLAQAGPSEGHWERCGTGLARDVGVAARPFLEEAALFGCDRVAAYALGVLGDQRSVAVLQLAGKERPEHAIAALRRMGAKGREAARTLDGGAVDAALEELSEPAPEDEAARWEWERRMAERLSAVRWDERMVDRVLRLLAGAGASNERVACAAMGALETVSDPRILDACLPFLPGGPRYLSGAGNAAIAAVHAQVGAETLDFLRRRVPAIDDRRTRVAAVLMYLNCDDLQSAARDAMAATLRREAVADGTETSRFAADGLSRIHFERPRAERNQADLAAVLAWVAGTSSPGGGCAVGTLVREKVPGAGEALLSSYRRGHDEYVASALAELHYVPALDSLRTEVARQVAEGAVKDWKHPGLASLARLCDEGRRYVRGLLTAPNAWQTRVAAAGALAVAGDHAAYADAAALLDDPAAVPTVPEDLAWALGILDPVRAHDDYLRRAAAARDAVAADAYAAAARDLERRRSDLFPPRDGK